ncbi:MAG: OmpH family outer membrane protein [Sedimentisphaerales bacterium]|jgi:Skp family chaperone for outer membrane proteins|nr:OmpH family outer membrane protein [Planctomycetota bacterium]MDY0354890.1 OmpH family outer membrane protein [Sedimentisphaerales bacterium]NLT75400.1 OmpH family outer membrane protein [Planctomycetota bacterium]
MKNKTIAMGVMICVVAVLATFQYGHAGPAATSASRIGVVSVRTVFNQCQAQTQYRAQAVARQNRARAELEAQAKMVEAAEAELKTLRAGTPDHLQQLQKVLKARAELESQQEFLNQQRMTQDKMWMEKLYQETLKIIATVAREKGLEVVLERTEPEFPISSEELMATFSTHKVLYADGCVDLTQEVMTRLDRLKDLKP